MKKAFQSVQETHWKSVVQRDREREAKAVAQRVAMTTVESEGEKAAWERWVV